MSRGRWFLPEMPDVLGLLSAQVAVTIEGLDALARWAGGEAAAAAAVRDARARGEAARRTLFGALRAAFVTPLEPEDVFALSRGADRILLYAHDLLTESEVMDCAPDAGIASMVDVLSEAMRHVDAALARLGTDHDAATAAAERALSVERRLELAYSEGMGALLVVKPRTERIALRELYRRCAKIGEMVIDVAERIEYAVVKQG